LEFPKFLTPLALVYRFRADLAGPLAWTLGLAAFWRRPQSFMSQPDDESQEALKRLQERLEAFDGERSPKSAPRGSVEQGVGEGYRLLGEVIGGVLGGIGLGWVVDRFAHTTPFGVVIGMLLGTAAATYAAVQSANRAGSAARRGVANEDGRDADD
jgi:ATP synthase protein I